MIDAEELREKIANTIVTTSDHSNVGSVGNYVGPTVMDAIMKTIVSEVKGVKWDEGWKPEAAEEYKCVNESGVVAVYCNREDKTDSLNFSTGNCYPMDTPDEVIAKEQVLIPQAMHRLKMAARKAWFEFDGSEGPDWGNHEQEKWYVYYDHADRKFTPGSNYFLQRGVLSCFPTRRSCQAYIHSDKDDLKLLFGVE